MLSRPILALLSLCLAQAPAVDLTAQPKTARLLVASTTDVHGRLRGYDYFGNRADTARGLARAATIVDSLRKTHPNQVVLLDAGDFLQGNPLTYVAARRGTTAAHPVIAAMNAMRYDAAAAGNHEFNYGVPFFRRAARQAHFPILAANIQWEKGQAQFLAPSRIVQRAGLRVGIVGATTPSSMIWDRDNLARRLRVTDIVPAVRREVSAVRARGADVVIVVMHAGLDSPASYDTVATGVPGENHAARVAREVPGVDLVVFGHSHQEVADTVINGVLLVQPRNWAGSVSVAQLDLERNKTKWSVRARKGVLVRTGGHAEAPRVVRAVERAHESAMHWVNDTLGSAIGAWRADSSRVMDTPLLDFTLEVMRRTSGAQLAATASFDLNASLDAGPVTVGEIARLYPYDNTLRVIRVTGKQLRDYLEYSSRYFRTLGTPEAAIGLIDGSVPGFNFDMIAGADYTIDVSRPLGSRITQLRVSGADVKDADSFTMALNNYRQSGGGGFRMLADAPLVSDKGEEIRDLLIAEVQKRGVLRAADYHTINWKLLPDSAAPLYYRDMRRGPFERSSDAPAEPIAFMSAHLRSGHWLRIIGTTDIHGALEAGDFNASGVRRGGLANLITVIENARAECPPPTCHSLWLDGGDQWQGTPASNRKFGTPVVHILNQFNLAASALGNHEFDWGRDTLRARLAQTRYQMLAANITDTLGKDIPWIPNDTLIDLGGLRVGVIGAISLETPTATRASLVNDLRFIDPAGVIDAHARRLRERGADAVVVTAHIGATCDRNAVSVCLGESVDVARNVREKIDGFVGGHSHRGVATKVNGVPIVQAYSRGTAIGIIDVPLASPGDTARVELRDVLADVVKPHAEVAQFVDNEVREIKAFFAAPVATLAESMHRGPTGTLGDLIADAQRAAGRGDVAIMNRGGVRTDLPAGTVTLGDIFNVAPFDNKLVRMVVKGAELRAYLERIAARPGSGFHLSGIRLTIDSSGVAASAPRLVSAVFTDGQAIVEQRDYVLVMSDFLAEGGDGLSLRQGAKDFEETGIVDRDALADYLRSRPQPVQPPDDPRLIYRK